MSDLVSLWKDPKYKNIYLKSCLFKIFEIKQQKIEYLVHFYANKANKNLV